MSAGDLADTALDGLVQLSNSRLPLLLGHLRLARLLPEGQDLLEQGVGRKKSGAMGLGSVQGGALGLGHLAALLRLGSLLTLLDVHALVLLVGELVVRHGDVGLVATTLRYGLLTLLRGLVIVELLRGLALALVELGNGSTLVVELAGGVLVLPAVSGRLLVLPAVSGGLLVLPAVGKLGRLGRGRTRGRVGSALLTVHF